MLYMKLAYTQQQEVLTALAGMQDFLAASFSTLNAEEAARPGPDGAFSPVEQVWHLADLEREGFGLRMQRLRKETSPELPDFDGDRLAQERNYKARSLLDGLQAFAAARLANLKLLQSLSAEEWLRSGSQEGVGGVTLCDLPVFMLQHDQAHMAEINVWKQYSSQQAQQ